MGGKVDFLKQVNKDLKKTNKDLERKNRDLTAINNSLIRSLEDMIVWVDHKVGVTQEDAKAAYQNIMDQMKALIEGHLQNDQPKQPVLSEDVVASIPSVNDIERPDDERA